MVSRSKVPPVIHVEVLWCKGCGLCVDYCSKGVLAMNDGGAPTVVALENCSRCLLCEAICPDFAIVVLEPPPPCRTASAA